MKQHEAVQKAMRENGGYATFAHLYQSVIRMPEWKSESLTPFASIRRIVQDERYFFKIRPGLWGLNIQRDSIGKELALPEYAPAHRAEDYSHSYYQGLLAEVGNLKQFQTFVPNQDKNKPFLHHRLSDVASLPSCLDFTYDALMRRAKTVDVTWFNSRCFPHAFFEVEHSTDIYNSLLKFVEFQDFRISFSIVADAARRKEFERKLQYAAFDSIRAEVKFLDYEKLSDLHTKLSETALLESAL
jgi:hypothetical protein